MRPRTPGNLQHLGGELVVMQKMLEFSQETFTALEVNNEILLNTDINGRNAWHIAAFGVNLDVIYDIW